MPTSPGGYFDIFGTPAPTVTPNGTTQVPNPNNPYPNFVGPTGGNTTPLTTVPTGTTNNPYGTSFVSGAPGATNAPTTAILPGANGLPNTANAPLTPGTTPVTTPATTDTTGRTSNTPGGVFDMFNSPGVRAGLSYISPAQQNVADAITMRTGGSS